MPTRSSVKNLFVYGTLTDKSLVHYLTGKTFSTSPAVLRDFKKLRSQFGFPYIVPRKGAKVGGLLIKQLDAESMRQIDRYEAEGRLYFRQRLQVLSRGRKVICEGYVGNSKRLYPHS